MDWDDLDKTTTPNARHCSLCHETVYLCRTVESFAEHAKQMHCVALVPDIDIQPKAKPSRSTLGRPAPWSFDLNEAAKKFWMTLAQDFPDFAPQITKELERKQTRNELLEAEIEAGYTSISFVEIETKVSSVPGIYEIWTNTGVPLKVGISNNLKKRLKQHASSPDCLINDEIDPSQPAYLTSKKSILAKHLYFDHAIADVARYDLTTQVGRRTYLANECKIKFQATKDTKKARYFEKFLEKLGKFRYARKIRVIKE